jgi:hypothetical protein
MNSRCKECRYEVPQEIGPGLQEVTRVTPQPEISWNPSKQRVYDIISRIVDEDEKDEEHPTIH